MLVLPVDTVSSFTAAVYPVTFKEILRTAQDLYYQLEYQYIESPRNRFWNQLKRWKSWSE